MNEFYNTSLLNFTIDSSKEAGLGIIDLRISIYFKPLNSSTRKIDVISDCFNKYSSS